MLNLDRSNWRRVKFGDVVENVNEYFQPEQDGVMPYVAGPHIDPDSALVTSWGSTDDVKFPPTFKRMFRTNDVFLHSRGVDKIASVDRSGVTGEKLFVLRTKDQDVLLQSFLIWLLRSDLAGRYFRDNFSGSVNKFLNWRPLAHFEFDLPPLDQQRRIADLLWAVERHAGRLRMESYACANLVMRHSDELIWSSGVEEYSLGDLLESCDYGTSSRCVPTRESGFTPVLRIPNVVAGELSLADLKFLPERRASDDPASLLPGDLLVVRTNGNPTYVGRGTLLGSLDEVMLYASYLLRMRVSERIGADYLAAVWSTTSLRRRLAPLIRSSAGNYNLSASSIRSVAIPVPSLAEQNRIVSQLGHLTTAESMIRIELLDCRTLGESLRERVMEGASDAIQ